MERSLTFGHPVLLCAGCCVRFQCSKVDQVIQWLYATTMLCFSDLKSTLQAASKCRVCGERDEEGLADETIFNGSLNRRTAPREGGWESWLVGFVTRNRDVMAPPRARGSACISARGPLVQSRGPRTSPSHVQQGRTARYMNLSISSLRCSAIGLSFIRSGVGWFARYPYVEDQRNET